MDTPTQNPVSPLSTGAAPTLVEGLTTPTTPPVVVPTLKPNSPFPVIPVTTVDLVDTVTKALLSIDWTKIPDNTFALNLAYSVECTDGVNAQIQSGTLHANVAKSASGTYATNAIATGTANTVTSGGMTITFSWTTSANAAVLNVNANSSLTPTLLRITFYVDYATHPLALSVVA